MNEMTFEEIVSFAEVFSVFTGLASPMSVTKQEKALAFEAMKKLADRRNDWTQEQKDLYKALAEIAKEYGK